MIPSPAGRERLRACPELLLEKIARGIRSSSSGVFGLDGAGLDDAFVNLDVLGQNIPLRKRNLPYSCEGEIASLSRIALGEGRLGNLHWISVQVKENPAMIMNIPNHPMTGFRTWVRMATTGAATAWPDMTRP